MNNKVLSTLLAFSALSGLGGYRPPKDNPLKGIDLDKEYELIKLKKSKLSSNQRRLVLQIKEGRNGTT